VFRLTLATLGAEPAPATPVGTVPVTLPPVVFDDLLFVECPRK
jgi:hypothetical protein